VLDNVLSEVMQNKTLERGLGWLGMIVAWSLILTAAKPKCIKTRIRSDKKPTAK